MRRARVWGGLFLLIALWAAPSWAYPFMIRHEYTGCAVCHVDPSGGYLLTPYGRAQTQTLLSTFGHGPPGDEVDKRSQFALGLVSPPEWLNLGGTLREAYFWSKGLSPKTQASSQAILMQADLRAAVTTEHFVATASLGYLRHGNHAAQVTHGDQDVLVSREFWAGVKFGDEQSTMLRAGRMYVPFGIRVIEHPFYVRTETDTNIDSQQEWGAALFHEEEKYRAEIMAIAGNYQVSPDAYRQRGYAGYFEYAVAPRLQLGVSSQLTYAKLDLDAGVSAFRGAHGPMLRWSPAESLAILVEGDLLHTVVNSSVTAAGLAGMAQLDWEVIRGLHGIVTTESYRPPFVQSGWFYRDWLSVAWFAYPHIDFRVDSYWSSEVYTSQRIDSIAALGQVHVSL